MIGGEDMSVSYNSDDLLKKLKPVFPYVEKDFQAIFPFVEYGNVFFIALYADKGLYLKVVNGKVIKFEFYFDDMYNLKMLVGENFQISYDDIFTYIDGDIAHCLSVFPTEFDYVHKCNGRVNYEQVNLQTKEVLSIQYPHMYREDSSTIYRYHLDNILYMFLDLKKSAHCGSFVGRKNIYYCNMEFESETFGDHINRVKTYGLIDFLNGKSYYLQKEPRVYSRIRYIAKDGDYYSLWPFSRSLTASELKALMRERGFCDSIPDDVLKLYNGEDEVFRNINDFLKMLKNQFGKKDNDDLGFKLIF